MSIVDRKIASTAARPYRELLLGAFAFVLAFAASLSSGNPNYESGVNDPSYYLRTGTVFFLPLTVLAVIVLALGISYRKDEARSHIVKAFGYLLDIVAFALYGSMSLVHYADRSEVARNLYFIASLINALPYFYFFVLELVAYLGRDVPEPRKELAHVLHPSFLGFGCLCYVMANYLYPDLHRVTGSGSPAVSYGLHFYLLVAALVIALLSGPVSYVAAKKFWSEEIQSKTDMVSGVLLAISGLIVFIDSFLIDGSGSFLYELYYVALAFGCALLLMGACLASYGEFWPRLRLDEAEIEEGPAGEEGK